MSAFPKRPRLKLSQAAYRKLCEYVYERDGWCVFCGTHNSATPAHVVRRTQGGDDSPRNIVRACITCHADFDQYKIALPERVRTMLENEPERI